MSNADSSEQATRSRVPRRKLEQAMSDVAEYRREYLLAVQAGRDRSDRFRRGFHAVVMNYYIELSNYKDKTAIEDEWDEILLWENGTGEVRGVDTLEEWLNRYETVSDAAPGRRRGEAGESRRAIYLSPDKLVAASRALDRLARDLGLELEVSEGSPRTEITEEMIEEVEEWRKQNLTT